MNQKKTQFSILAAVAFASILSTSAQETADPYKKEAAPKANPQSSENAAQVSLHFSAFSLPIREAFMLLNDFPTDGDRYTQVVKLAGEGKVKIERMLIMRTKSGQRALTESILEFRYPTQYTVPDSKPASEPKAGASPTQNPVFPIAFETRNTGDTFEVEPVVSEDNTTIDLNLVPQSVRYLGDRDLPSHSGFEQPIFETQKTSTSFRVRVGHPFLMGTPNPPFYSGLKNAEGEQRIWLDFVTAYVIDTAGNVIERSPIR